MIGDTMATRVTRTPRGAARPATRVVVGAVLLMGGLALGYAVTAVGAAGTGELALDVSISHHRDAVLTAVARAVDVGFGTMAAPLLLLVVGAILWTRSRYAAVTFTAMTALGWLSVEVGKVLVHRPRPPAATVHALVSETASDSYPSGHTAFAAAAMFAAAATLMLAGRGTRSVWIVGVPSVVAVGLTRMYLGVHYLADVFASAVFAGAAVLLATIATRPILKRLREGEQEGMN